MLSPQFNASRNDNREQLQSNSERLPKDASEKLLEVEDVEMNSDPEIRYFLSKTWPSAEEINADQEKIIQAAKSLPENHIIAHSGTYWFISQTELSIRSLEKKLPVLRSAFGPYHVYCIWIDSVMSIDFYDNVKGKFLGITLDCVTNDTEEENSSPFQADEISSNSNSQQNMSKEPEFNEQTSSEQLIFDPNNYRNARPRIRYIRAKDVGTRLRGEALYQKIIERAVPLPTSHELNIRTIYWFVTTEPVEVMHSIAKQSMVITYGGYYLLSIPFPSAKVALNFSFGDGSVVHISAKRPGRKSPNLVTLDVDEDFLRTYDTDRSNTNQPDNQIATDNFLQIYYVQVPYGWRAHEATHDIIQMVKPLPEDNNLAAQATYLLVTIEQVDVSIYGSCGWNETSSVHFNGINYYLNIMSSHDIGWAKFQGHTRSRDIYFGYGFEGEYLPNFIGNIQTEPAVTTVNTQFEYLELGNVIGEGNFGTIYLAECKGTKYAVKKFKLYDNKKEEIEKEAKALQLVQHERIVTLVGITNDQDGKIMLVMEYMEDGSLADFLKSSKLTKETAIQIALDVAEGLQYLHSLKIIHRDLKSANVLLYANKTRAKLSDFGTVRIFGESSKATTILGTVGFMAPEILQEEPYNAKADIYSFGALMFQMLTNKSLPAFFSNKARAKVSEVQYTEFQTLILQCCEIDPTARPTIEQCIQKLNEMRQQNLENYNNM